MFKETPAHRKILDAILNSEENVQVQARAGSGKTTTIKFVLSKISGLRGTPRKSLVLCFNSSICEELRQKITDWNVDIMTINSLGLKMWRSHLIVNNRVAFTKHRPEKMKELADSLKVYPQRAYAARMVAQRAKKIGADTNGLGKELVYNRTLRLPDGADIDFETGQWDALARKMVLESNDLSREGEIDFADQVYMPVKDRARPFKFYDYVFVDEAQDLSPIQHQLLEVACEGAKLISVGDPEQAIYGFRGACSDSMRLLSERTETQTCSLNVTYRCAKTIVAEAQEFVPDLCAHEDAPEGKVRSIESWKLSGMLRPGDLVLSRLNHPLIKAALGAYQEKSENILVRGQNIPAKIRKTVNELRSMHNNEHGYETFSSSLLLDQVQAWRRREKNRLGEDAPASARARVFDDAACVTHLLHSESDVRFAYEKLERVFQSSPGKSQIVFSTIHKAKGTEADRVFILNWHEMPLQWGDPKEEANLAYVAITRAKHSLFYVQPR